MAVSEEKKQESALKDVKADDAGKKLATEMPLSEKDEVKNAEHQTNKGAAKAK